MATMDEIRQRIEQADQARLQARVDTATKIATLVQRRAEARSDLAELEAMAATEIEAASAVMTVDELAGFTGIPITELRMNGKAKAVPVRKTRTARVPTVRDRRGRPVATPVEQDVPVQE